MMMVKSVFSKMQFARGRGRNFSSRVTVDRGMRKDLAKTWPKFVFDGMQIICGAIGIASGYGLTAAVFPNHSEDAKETEKRFRAHMEQRQIFIIKMTESVKELEERIMEIESTKN